MNQLTSEDQIPQYLRDSINQIKSDKVRFGFLKIIENTLNRKNHNHNIL